MTIQALSGNTRWKSVVFSGLCTFVIFLILMAINQYAPFGLNSFAQVDATIQYLDFFSYLKHLLQGEASWTFSFDRGIGGNIWVVLTYYLSSPWNFLVVFFRQENFHTFYNLLVLIKVSLSAITMAFYLDQRFEHHLSSYLLIALAMSFGLMQYNLEQARNIMWLDGVYMLPLILWGVYQVREEKSILWVVIPGALSLAFGWYTGLIDLLFTGFWAIWEVALLKLSSWCSWKKCLGILIRVWFAILLSIMLVSIIFIPTLKELSNGRTSSFDWGLLRASWNGRIKALFEGLTWGTFSSQKHASLFSGSLVLLGMMGFFFSKEISRRIRYLAIFMLLFSIVILYWQPFFLLFSLLKDASSYWYRYAYVSIFFFIWLAGAYFSASKNQFSSWKVAVFIPVLWIVLQLYHSYNSWGNIIGVSVLFLGIMAAFIGKNKVFKKYGNLVLLLLVTVDLGFNASYILQHQDAFHEVQAYHDYVVAEQRQIPNVVPKEGNFYRISQTRTFQSSPRDKENHTTANYNEGLAYLYPTVASYTSSPVNTQLNFLDRLGYRRNGDNMNIVNTSLLGTDSLLGVRYVLADYAIPGLVLVQGDDAANKKAVYENPFVMPIAFRIPENVVMHHPYADNPFQFANELYADIFQQNTSIYKPVIHQVVYFDGQKKADFRVTTDRKGAVYGNFPFRNKDLDGYLILNDSIRQRYAAWASPSVFSLSMSEGIGKVHWQSAKEAAGVIDQAQFYQVDENALKWATAKAWERAATVQRDSDTFLHIKVEAETNEKLFTSIPVHEGWHVTCNGEAVKPQAFEDSLMIIPLQPGHNDIQLTFELPGWKLGAVLTLFSIIVCGFLWKRKI